MLGKPCVCLCGLDCCEALWDVRWTRSSEELVNTELLQPTESEVENYRSGQSQKECAPCRDSNHEKKTANPKDQVYIATVQTRMENRQQSPDEPSLSFQVWITMIGLDVEQ